MNKLVSRLLLVVVLAGAGYGIFRFFQNVRSKQTVIPVTKVRRGDVIVRSFTRGELRAVRTATLTAPNLMGTVQVTKLAPLGALAREKDLIVEFDDAEVEARLEQRQLELEQVDEQIKQKQAELAIRNNQDEVELLRTRYSVRRAELEVKRNELLSTIDQKKNLLNLEEARRRLKQLESDVKSRREQAQAELNVLRERRNRNLLDINREKMRLMQVKLLSPISGLVAIKQNRSGFSGMFGTTVPDIREGDQVSPGIPVADILDLSELEVVARVGELDRANLRDGQEVMIRLDALAGHTFKGAIKSMSGTASANVFSSDPGKKFDVLFSIDMPQLLTALGASKEQIARIMATAEENRKKPIATSTASMFAGGLPGFGGGMPEGMAGGQMGGGQMMVMQGGEGGMMAGGQGGQSEGGGQRRAMFMMGGGQGGVQLGGQQLTPEQQKQMQAIMQKVTGGKSLQEMTPEERQAAFAKLREEAQKAGIQMPQRRREGGGEGQQGGQPGGAQQAGARMPVLGPQGPGAAGGEAGAGGRARGEGRGNGGGGVSAGMMGMGMGVAGQFSAKDLENAKLPPPPEESNAMDVLLRPGLLADVEIIVEKVPNAIYIPNQSLFEKDGKPVVYVKRGEKFEPQVVQIAKRSEALTIISSGINPGDTIALADPFEKPGEKKKSEEKKGSGGPMGAMPVSKGGQQ
jgi:hypothetical protein